MRHNLLLAGLALTLAPLAVSSASAQTTGAPLPVDQARTYGIKSPTSSRDEVPPAVTPKEPKAKPASGERDTGVHRLEMFLGPTRTVHYYAKSGSPSEQAALRKLEQAENEMALVDSLQALRQQYVNTEFMMEARRRELQRKLYGYSTDDKVSASQTYPAIGLGEPSPFGTPFAVGYNAGFGGSFGGASPLGYGGGMGGGGPYAGYGIGRVTMAQESHVNQSLANGIGDEGKFKTAMVTEMARMASPESASTAVRNYELALTNVIGERARSGGIEAATFEKMTPRKVTVTTTANEKITGLLVRRDNDWITIRTDDTEETLRMTDVKSIKMELKK